MTQIHKICFESNEMDNDYRLIPFYKCCEYFH